jgi:hypothetical protein
MAVRRQTRNNSEREGRGKSFFVLDNLTGIIKSGRIDQKDLHDCDSLLVGFQEKGRLMETITILQAKVDFVCT